MKNYIDINSKVDASCETAAIFRKGHVIPTLIQLYIEIYEMDTTLSDFAKIGIDFLKNNSVTIDTSERSGQTLEDFLPHTDCSSVEEMKEFGLELSEHPHGTSGTSRYELYSTNDYTEEIALLQQMAELEE